MIPPHTHGDAPCRGGCAVRFPTRARAWAWQQDTSHKKLLLALAEHADDDTGECWPGKDKLLGMCGLSDKLSGVKHPKKSGHVTLQRQLDKLVKEGLLTVETARFDPTGRQTTNIYSLALGDFQLFQATKGRGAYRHPTRGVHKHPTGGAYRHPKGTEEDPNEEPTTPLARAEGALASPDGSGSPGFRFTVGDRVRRPRDGAVSEVLAINAEAEQVYVRYPDGNEQWVFAWSVPDPEPRAA